MKKTLSNIFAALALGGASATAATVFPDVSLQTTTIPSFDPSTSKEGGNFNGFTAVLNADWLAATDSKGNAFSSGSILDFTLQTLTVDQRRSDSGYHDFAACKMAIMDVSTSNYIAVSDISTSSDNKISFTFGLGGIQLDMNTNYSFRFVTESTVLSGTTVTGGSFINRQLACWSNTNAGTDDITAGIGDANGFKPGITLTGLATVPEPSTAFLSLLGLGALLLRRRRR